MLASRAKASQNVWIGEIFGWSRSAAADAGLATCILPQGLRLRRAGELTLVFNYLARSINLPAGMVGKTVLGDRLLGPEQVRVLRSR